MKVYYGSMEETARELLRRAATGFENQVWPGSQGATSRSLQERKNASYLKFCTVEHHETGTLMMLTRTYEPHARQETPGRVIHLSLSFVVPGSRSQNMLGRGQTRKRDVKLSHEWCRLFFRHRLPWVWVMKPLTELGRLKEVWHYYLFMDEQWRPIKTEQLPDSMSGYTWLAFREVQEADGVM